jgi:hypothetical protein
VINGAFEAAFIIQSLLVLFLLVLILGILQYLQRVKTRWEEIAVPITSYETGDVIDNVQFNALDGRHIDLSEMAKSSSGVVLFVLSRTCSSCHFLTDQITEVMNRREGKTCKKSIVIVYRESAEKLRTELLGVWNSEQCTVVPDERGELIRRLGIGWVPTALVLDTEGRVVDQSRNPHIGNWTYRALGVPPSTDIKPNRRLTVVMPVR